MNNPQKAAKLVEQYLKNKNDYVTNIRESDIQWRPDNVAGEVNTALMLGYDLAAHIVGLLISDETSSTKLYAKGADYLDQAGLRRSGSFVTGKA